MLNLTLNIPKQIDAIHWILDVLNRHKAIYQISGGLASLFYGANRPLNDIDIDIDNRSFFAVMKEVKPFLAQKVGFYKEAHWQLQHFAKINYGGQIIELVGIHDSLILKKDMNQWAKYRVNLFNRKDATINRIKTYIVSKKDLMAYKYELKRAEDMYDLDMIKKMGAT